MDDMDFTKPAPENAAAQASAPFKAANSRFYNSDVAGQIFRASGKEQMFDRGATLFVEDDKASKGRLFSAGSRMYFIAEGEVELSIGGKQLDIVKAGEVVGEMAVITGRPRSATATARSICQTFSMDAGELQAALGKT